MAVVKFKGSAVHTVGNLPAIGSSAVDFELVKNDLSRASVADYAGKKVILNIFPSIDTGICAASVREFNKRAASLENTVVLCVSRDLPFAQSRFCGAEGIQNVETLSDFETGEFGKNYGLTFSDGPLKGLHSRSVVVLNEEGKVIYAEQVAETTEEPNYEAAIAVL